MDGLCPPAIDALPSCDVISKAPAQRAIALVRWEGKSASSLALWSRSRASSLWVVSD